MIKIKQDKIRILVIDDEAEIRNLLKLGLTAHGYEIIEASTGRAGITQVGAARPDLLILDMGLPDMEGTDVVKSVRQWCSVPIIILSVREQEYEKIRTLDEGADDYLTKPFGMGELLARIRVALRHISNENILDKPVLELGELKLDLEKHMFFVKGNEIKLTPTEYDLLKILAINCGKVITHRQLLIRVWGEQYQEENHYLRIYIRQLRKKIEADPTQPRYILTEPGVGYRLAFQE